MNLFLVGWSAALSGRRPGAADPEGLQAADRAAAVLEALRAPFFADEAVERWTAPSGRAAAAWLSHAPERLGGVRYAAAEGGRLALFAGRPIRWQGDAADGRGPLDPALYLTESWEDALDGRFAVVRAGDEGVDVVTDPLGAYPVFRCEADGTVWVSNSPWALRQLRGPAPLDLDALAGVLGGGWSLDGVPLWKGITRVPWRASTAVPSGSGFDPDRAARLLTEGTRALADWPGRPNVVLVTGGRDSRLILAAAQRAGIAFEARTGGTPDAPDVVLGRQVAEAAGVEHGLLAPHPHGDFMAHWRAMAATLARTTGGTATLGDAAGFPLGPNPAPPAPLPLWHTGQGGEIARGYYGAAGGDPVGRLYRAFTGRRPGRTEPLSAEGARRVREQIATWADQQRAAGARDEDLPDLFYLHRRMATWAAPTHAAVEPIRDSTSPLWSAWLLPDLLGLPAARRAREEFHLRVLERLAPELVDLPFEGGRPWPAKQGALGRRALRVAVLARKARAEAGRQWAARAAAPPPPTAGPAGTAASAGAAPPGDATADPFAAVLPEIRDVVLADADHPAWRVLDRARVEELLSRPAAGLDAMSRAYVWRLATVFGGFPTVG